MHVTGAQPHIDVCIASYKRPRGLRMLLESLVAQETHGLFGFRIIVVDNDARCSAEDVVKACPTRGVDIVYDVEPEQNIALARNRGFAHAGGDYIATIDDDEYADREWLATLLAALIRYQADGVFGPEIPIFPPDTPEFIRQCEPFTLPDPPTGSTEYYADHTGNAFLRRAVVEGTPGPFDPSLGLTGGEDTALFGRLRRQGCKLVWCREARVFTQVPRERATLRWITKRAFRNGNACHLARHEGPFGPDIAPRAELVRASNEIAQRSCAALLYLLAALFDAKNLSRATAHLRRVAYLLGLCAYHFHFRYEAYRRRSRGAPPTDQHVGRASRSGLDSVTEGNMEHAVPYMTRPHGDGWRRWLLRVAPVHVMGFLARHPPFGEVCSRVATNERVVALTYDDGPNPPYTLDLLDVLDGYRVHATFFMVGQNIESHPDVAREVLRRGHAVGNHSYRHPALVLRPPSFVRLEIAATDALLRRMGAVGEIYFRCPYGTHLFAVPFVLAQQNRRHILFDVGADDWRTQDPSCVARRVVDHTRPGSIILLHDGGGARHGTVAATGLIIEALRNRGYAFVSIGELLAHAAA